MSFILGLVQFVCLVVAAGCGRIDFDPTNDDLIAWYPLDSLDAGATLDQTGHGHTATCDPTAATCPRIVPGRRGNALQFDGVDDLLAVASSPAFSTPAFTVALCRSTAPTRSPRRLRSASMAGRS
jgi:hypothetical protein